MTIKDLNPKLINPDQYLVEEDQMGNSTAQTLFIRYEISVLERLYREESWLIAGELNHYHEAIENSENLIVPDIAVFKGILISIEEQPKISSWNMRKGDKPCPPLVIESSSNSNYDNDINLEKKPRLYGLIGVKEYLAYDPNPRPVWPKRVGTRLLGWRYDAQGNSTTIKTNEEGRMWSEVLDSWLEPDGLYLRLYDREGQLRLTGEEAGEKQVKIEAQARLQAEEQAKTEAQRANTAEQRIAELERQLAEARRQSPEKQ